MRKPRSYFSLMRPKLRLSWNKHNVYNLARSVGKDQSMRDNMTFFQMKWSAKSRTRAYHGDHITEKKWKRMFSHRLMSAVDLPPQYLAANDGSEQAAGRGSGLATNDVSAEKYAQTHGFATEGRVSHFTQRPMMKRGDPAAMLSKHHTDMTPYMQMAYAPLERRLDMAVFRALFASSVRQARQFVIHGAVQVNGKKMVHPSYRLNPGDMFQVDVEKVLYGTGVQKESGRVKTLESMVEAREQREVKGRKENIEKLQEFGVAKRTAATSTAQENAEEENAEEEDAETVTKEDQVTLESLGERGQFLMSSLNIKTLLQDVRNMLREPDKQLTAKDKKRLRLFKTSAKRFLSIPDGASTQELIEDLRLQLANHRTLFEKTLGVVEPTKSKDARDKPFYEQGRLKKVLEGLPIHLQARLAQAVGSTRISNADMRNLAKLMKEDEMNPIDETKSYATPWRPRPFMSAFAFIPRYLEVNPNVCAAVYLRHPVARKGMSEVPTPFSYLTNQLAHNWYLQRGPRDRT